LIILENLNLKLYNNILLFKKAHFIYIFNNWFFEHF